MSARPRRTGTGILPRPVPAAGRAGTAQAVAARRVDRARGRPHHLLGLGGRVQPFLAVRTVEVVGVPAAEVAPITAMAQVTLGAPLARLDADGIADRVRQRATLANVSIERSWPSTLVIHASPRVPVLVAEPLKVNYTLWIVEAWRMRRSGPLPRVSRWCTQPRTSAEP